MTRAQRLVYCEKCTLRDFSPESGMICSLTNQHAAFEGTCPDFNEDYKATRAPMVDEVASDKSSGIVLGVGMIILAIVWFVAGIVAMDRIFFYPIALVIFGFISIAKGASK